MTKYTCTEKDRLHISGKMKMGKALRRGGNISSHKNLIGKGQQVSKP
jgi:hypothetical protein